MKTGNGKIANLPSSLRDELNIRISDGDPGNELVEWLNAKPEVAEVINKLFDGAPISEQNLSEWRKRGYQKWLAHRNSVDESNAVSDNTEDIAATGIDCDKLILTLTAAYAEMTRNWIITPREDMTYKLGVYKNLTNAVINLQRAELQKVRLEIARERLELLREKRQNKSDASFGSPKSASADAKAPQTLASPVPSSPVSVPKPIASGADPAPRTSPQPAAAVPPPAAQTAAPKPAPANPPKLAAPQDIPLWPSRRPSGPPPNATPRNPLGLL
jgi:hypothetical protein